MTFSLGNREVEMLNGMAWIAADWGTTNLRVWAIDADGHILAQASSDKGMSTLERDGFEPALIELIGNWLPTADAALVIACGMVGAKQGWIEVPYRQAPCTPLSAEQIGVPNVRDPRLKVRVLPGIKQITPADVMRGEETQIAGVLQHQHPNFEGVICLPGTHTKWAKIAAGTIVNFRTFMTGEIFNLLSKSSVLRYSLDDSSWDATEFARSAQTAATDPQGFAGRLFGIRAEALLSGLTPAMANARLSGTLIGAELAAARSYWLVNDVLIVGDGKQARLYYEALRTLGKASQTSDASSVTLAGLKAAHTEIMKA
jgi:2-dehydro-3-deoxygalactonokinase